MKPTARHFVCDSSASDMPAYKNTAPIRLAVIWLVWLAAAPTQAQSLPWAFTQVAGPVSASAATITGMVVPNGLPTVAWFEWGTNGSFDLRTPPQAAGSGTQVVCIKASLAGLDTIPTARFRLVASNELGVSRGAMNQFTARGLLTGWGANDKGQLNAPAGLGWLTTVTCGANHSLALKTDGTVAAWGFNTYGQINVPAGLSNVIALAGGTSHSLALKTDGSIQGWGLNLPASPPVTNLVAIAAGFNFNVGVMSNDLCGYLAFTILFISFSEMMNSSWMG